jgi:hypothetical protein
MNKDCLMYLTIRSQLQESTNSLLSNGLVVESEESASCPDLSGTANLETSLTTQNPMNLYLDLVVSFVRFLAAVARFLAAVLESSDR